ncbi:glycerophosphodiester phosphodiesterase [Cohnella massiliensis]|uniref:glycerophosphodiester phosphodiesterase n=2 Tax=Cohnella TaxID=329857 RepID=UPI0009BAE27D|nr:glycerophosphodiester phosphodiesterase family protein [Cohnella massiliensis]
MTTQARPTGICWQAHRGGGAHEAPDNTMAANRYAWKLGGIPEADIRTTKDGVIVCLHDETASRTTTAPAESKDKPISALTFEETRAWDAGIKFDAKFRGEKIPALEEAFSEMRGHPERMMYLDLKDANLVHLGRLIDRYGVNGQLIFTHHRQENCREMKRIADGVRSMLWIGGNGEQIRLKFEQALKTSFDGLDQVQLHLNEKPERDEEWRYELEPDFLAYALREASRCGVDLEVLPFAFDKLSIRNLLDLGIRWFATDEPSRFLDGVRAWDRTYRFDDLLGKADGT